MATQAEVIQPQKEGLPQFDFATFESQIIWLTLTFVAFYLLVSRVALPRVTQILGEREETIAGNLDDAERLRREADEVRASYEAAIAQARAGVQQTIQKTKDAAQADIAKVQAKLDAKLAKDAAAAEANIAEAKAEALDGLEAIAVDVASDMIAKLSGTEVTAKDIGKAVITAMAGKEA